MLEFRIKQTLDPFCIKCLNSKWYHRTHNMKKSYTGKIILPKCKQQQRKRYFFILIFSVCLFWYLLGTPETNFNGLRTRIARNVLRSTPPNTFISVGMK